MSEIRVADRYAKALFDMAKEKNSLDEIRNDAETFLQLCNASHDFLLMLRSPIVHLDSKRKVIEKTLTGKVSELTLSFMKIVLRKKREHILDVVFKRFVVMYDETKGILHAKVYTAVKISDAIRSEVNTFLAKETKAKVQLTTEIKPEILGGFVLQYNDKLVDASVASQLRQLRKQLMNAN